MGSKQQAPPLDIETIVDQVRIAIGRHPLDSDSVPELLSNRREHGLISEVHASLRQARIASGHLGVRYKVGWRTPIVGQVWAIVRRRIHAEIRIYIDGLTDQQIAFNGHILRAVSPLVETVTGMAIPASFDRMSQQLSDQEDEIRQLTAEVSSLGERMSRLEANGALKAAPGQDERNPEG